MKIEWGKIVKIVVPVASIATALASNYLSDKEMDEKVAKKVAEALNSEKN